MTEVAKPAQASGTVSGQTAAQAAPPPGRAATDAPAATTPIPVGQVEWLLATTSRAPSIHNTQPWRFRVGEDTIELHSDPDSRLRMDRGGREMLISCGAALFGLRLAVRGLGYLPEVDVFPDDAHPDLIARVTLGQAVAATEREKRLLAAVPHRHTHRGAFEEGELPAGLPVTIGTLAGGPGDALSRMGPAGDNVIVAGSASGQRGTRAMHDWAGGSRAPGPACPAAAVPGGRSWRVGG